MVWYLSPSPRSFKRSEVWQELWYVECRCHIIYSVSFICLFTLSMMKLYECRLMQIIFRNAIHFLSMFVVKIMCITLIQRKLHMPSNIETPYLWDNWWISKRYCPCLHYTDGSAVRANLDGEYGSIIYIPNTDSMKFSGPCGAHHWKWKWQV